MTVVRELMTLLSFKMNDREATRYEQRLNQVANNVNRFAAGIGASLAGAFGVRELIQAGDAYTMTMNRLRAATGGPDGAAEAFEKLYASARETGVAVSETSKAFSRFSPAMARAGMSVDDTIALVDGIQKGLLAAGSTATETSSVFLQLGQAINSGTFAGDELRAFLEAAPASLVNKFAEALGTTSDKLKELGSQGKLTTKNVLPALLAAARAGRKEFEAMKTPVQLAMDRSRVAVDRFIGEFDRAFLFTERLARQIERVGVQFDEWRKYIPRIREAANEFGGLNQILGAVALGAGAVTVATIAMNGVFGVTLARLALLTGSIAFVGAALQEVYTYVKNDGTKTLIEEWIGPYDQVAARLKPVLEELKASFLDLKAIMTGAPDEVAAAWERLAARIKAAFSSLWSEALDASGLPDWAKERLGGRATATPEQRAARAERSWWGPVGTLPPGEVEGPDPILEWLQSKARDVGGWLGLQQRVEQPDGSMRLLAPGEAMSDAMLRRGAGSSGNVTVTSTVTAPVEVTVTATGTSGAEIAGAAERGVTQGMDQVRLNADRQARDLLSAIPGVEGAGGTTGGGF
jgi:tape measure domain-containing protein